VGSGADEEDRKSAASTGTVKYVVKIKIIFPTYGPILHVRRSSRVSRMGLSAYLVAVERRWGSGEPMAKRIPSCLVRQVCNLGCEHKLGAKLFSPSLDFGVHCRH
jgi:hypothetical protein